MLSLSAPPLLFQFFETLADYADEAVFVVLFGLAVGSAVSMVAQRNPLYSAISLIFVFMALAGLYLLLAAPFIAAIQVIVYAGAIMVLVIFVIMLLNVEEAEQRKPLRLRLLVPAAVVMAAVLFAESAFILYFVHDAAAEQAQSAAPSNTGLTASIGAGLFTTYLLPFEITSALILMAIVGAITLARRASDVRPTDVVVPGSFVLARQTLTPEADVDATPVHARTTDEVGRELGLAGAQRRKEEKD
ncbi:MAG TPA: NADH-quinone oxidoreductase subunit J [Pyrinomonadaceae bacterium]|nr:NADH-quinone oxidoreductase subunit J [Pyrinomonadaceae bacterium]